MSATLFQLISENEVLTSGTIYLDFYSETYDGVFPTAEDYIKFAKRIDDYGASGYLDYITNDGEFDVISFDGCELRILDKDKSLVELTFIEPISVEINFGGNKIPQVIKTLQGVITYECYDTTNEKKLQNKYFSNMNFIFNVTRD